MKRRFLQFSLRGLLGVVVLVCLSLGGWRLLETFSNRLDVEGAQVGVPIRLKGRCVWLLGPPEGFLKLGYEVIEGMDLGDGAFAASKGRHVKRSWPCLYTMKSEFPPIDHRCRIVVYLERREDEHGFLVRRLKEKLVDVK